MPQLDFTTYSAQIFWLVICFSMLYASSSLVILPRIKKILANRKRIIDSDLRHTTKLEEEISELEESSKQLRSNAAKEYQDAVTKANEKAIKYREHSLELYRIESEKIMKESKQRMLDFIRQIESEKYDIIQQIAELIRKKTTTN